MVFVLPGHLLPITTNYPLKPATAGHFIVKHMNTHCVY